MRHGARIARSRWLRGASVVGSAAMLFSASCLPSYGAPQASDSGASLDAPDGGDAQPSCAALTLTGGSVVAPAQAYYNVESFTLEAWIMPSTTMNGSQNVIHHWGDANKSLASYALSIDASLAPAVSVTCDGKTLESVPASATLTIGHWAHVAAFFDSSTRELGLYVNGAFAGSQLARCSRPYPVSGVPLTIGYEDPVFSSHPFRGALAEVRVSSVVRYAGPFTPSPKLPIDADTIAAFDFDPLTGSTATTAADTSSHHNDAALTSGAKLGEACRP